ncbi:MAG: TIGR02300 family protein [Pseudomonadota bacterium]
MPKDEWGVKRLCPETGKRFYDLNKEPIVSPYTGKEYDLSFFTNEKSKTSMADKEDKSALKKATAAEDQEDIDVLDENDNDDVDVDLGDDVLDEDDDDGDVSLDEIADVAADDEEN